jgi:hypothetical protein
LADNDRAGADDEDGGDVGAFWHWLNQLRPHLIKSSVSWHSSLAPGRI